LKPTTLAQIVVESPERLDLSLVGERKRPTEAGSCLTRLGVSVRTWSGKLEWLLISGQWAVVSEQKKNRFVGL